jgi:hypothetical protein
MAFFEMLVFSHTLSPAMCALSHESPASRRITSVVVTNQANIKKPSLNGALKSPATATRKGKWAFSIDRDTSSRRMGRFGAIPHQKQKKKGAR